MFKGIKEKTVQNERVLFTVISFLSILVIFVNSETLKSFFVGIFALIIYLVINAEILGRAFFEGENHLFKLAFGLLLFIILMALMAMLALVVSQLEIWYLLGMIFAAIATSIVSQFLRYERSQKKTNNRKEAIFKDLNIMPMYGLYIALFVLSFFILFNERSGWIVGPIWNITPPIFLPIYLITTAILVGIILLPGKINVKLFLIVFHSIFSLLFLVIVLYPGVIYNDPWFELARARVVLPVTRTFVQSASFRSLNSLLRGYVAHALIAMFSRVLNVDMYWSYVLLVPMLWGFFVPLISYKITKMITGEKRTSILAAFLTIPNLYFLAWGKLTEACSLGILFTFFLLYLLLRFLLSRETRMFFLITMILITVVATHFLPTLMSISFVVLAFALKKYEHVRLKSPRMAYFLLFVSFILSVFLLPLAVIGRGVILPMLGTSAFSIDKALNANIWELVLGVPEALPFQDAMLYQSFPPLGLIGLVYALKRKAKFKETLCFFSFLAFGASMIVLRILEFTMVGGIFGAGRLRVFIDMLALPFAAIVIASAIEFLLGAASTMRSFFRWRSLLVETLICLCLSAWVTATVYETYEYYTWGLLGTSLEVDAIKYIDEHTEGRYVVLAPLHTALIGWGFMGNPNFEKYYVDVRKTPSVADMFQFMETAGADVGYFMVTSVTGGNINKTIDEASRVFGLFKVLSNENGKIYIFNYKIPPLPLDADVMAFYWDTPPAYYIQNDLVRVMINPALRTLDVRDFWGDLYESIELDRTLVDAKSLGNLTTIEYFDDVNNKWVEWAPHVEISPAEKFQFKLRFESESLIGVVNRGEPLVNLRWESNRASTLSLEVGVFTRLYIPGLIGGRDSYDVNSREHGFFYTRSLSDDVVLHPAYAPEMNKTSLTYSEIKSYGGFDLTQSYVWYDLYVHNNASMDQWAYIEVWLPDMVYTGSSPPLWYSVDDGETWVFPRYNVETNSSEPIRTLGGVEVNWIYTIPRNRRETPTEWWSYTNAYGGFPLLPGDYTASGGAQNRMIFAFYLPAGDKALVRLGSPVHYVRPLETSYVFRDSENVYYGLRNMKEGLIKFYNLGPSEYVGGLRSTEVPTSLTITQDDADKVNSIVITLPSNSTFLLLSRKGVDTTRDLDDDGIPDLIQQTMEGES